MNGYNRLPDIPLDIVKKTNEFIKDCEREAAKLGFKALEYYCGNYKKKLQTYNCILEHKSLPRFCECLSETANETLEDTVRIYGNRYKLHKYNGI